MPLKENIKAPDFTLQDETGEKKQLSSYLGTPLVLYFYPKDDTPGCTTEACSFRDDYSEFEKAGVVILGVSPDSPQKHAKFKEKYQLPFSLLADVDHVVCELYQVWGRKKFMGKEYDGVFRTTYIIDRDGMIKKVFENVKPSEHVAEVLREV
jgi:peroxiredoxin Q/BCP